MMRDRSGLDDRAVDHAVDVAVLGDGPAGWAIADTLTANGVDTVVIGPGQRWAATYGGWFDDIPTRWRGAFAPTAVAAVGSRLHPLAPQYAIADNDALRASMSAATRHRVGRATEVRHLDGATHVMLDDGSRIRCRLAVDARGAPTDASTRQTAYGLVLDRRPDGVAGDAAVLMDWRQPTQDGEPSFLYVMPVGHGRWIVEETSLASDRPPPPGVLRTRLAVRLGADLTDSAVHVEHVSIPMAAVARTNGATVAFGAAAGYVHPATGYSVVAALRAAPRVAAAITDVLDGAPLERAHRALWPRELRLTRSLHTWGLRALLKLGDRAPEFFDAFFELPTEQWMAYLRIDTPPHQVARTMGALFTDVPWSLRRSLLLVPDAGRT
jgi:lycopene beta-cyclase